MPMAVLRLRARPLIRLLFLFLPQNFLVAQLMELAGSARHYLRCLSFYTVLLLNPTAYTAMFFSILPIIILPSRAEGLL
ncbi:hypothetical protein F5Y10DRAFT_236127 [Nemania abortiva]|nr:hypothetical protein F5Y10DRAFT_236127 [Nemania abortiva]